MENLHRRTDLRRYLDPGSAPRVACGRRSIGMDDAWAEVWEHILRTQRPGVAMVLPSASDLDRALSRRTADVTRGAIGESRGRGVDQMIESDRPELWEWAEYY